MNKYSVPYITFVPSQC